LIDMLNINIGIAVILLIYGNCLKLVSLFFLICK
jgi:hypothetical protein